MRSSDAPVIGAAQQVPATLDLLVFPGLSSGEQYSSQYYDDDGKTLSYQNGAYATTTTTLCIQNQMLSKLRFKILMKQHRHAK